MRKQIRFVLAAAVLPLAAVVPSAPAAPAPAKLTAKSLAFSPSTVKLKVGQRLVVTNADTVPHTVTEGAMDSHGSMSMRPAFDTGTIAAGKSTGFVVTKPGTYTFHCHIHPSMTGKIVVSR